MLRLLIIWNILHVHNLLHIPFFPIILFCCFHFSDLIESAFAIIYQHKFSSRSGKSRVMLFKYIPNDSNDCFSCKLLTKFRIFFFENDLIVGELHVVDHWALTISGFGIYKTSILPVNFVEKNFFSSKFLWHKKTRWSKWTYSKEILKERKKQSKSFSIAKVNKSRWNFPWKAYKMKFNKINFVMKTNIEQQMWKQSQQSQYLLISWKPFFYVLSSGDYAFAFFF